MFGLFKKKEKKFVTKTEVEKSVKIKVQLLFNKKDGFEVYTENIESLLHVNTLATPYDVLSNYVHRLEASKFYRLEGNNLFLNGQEYKLAKAEIKDVKLDVKIIEKEVEHTYLVEDESRR